MKNERASRIQDALRSGGLDVLICALPANVLMMTGYAPVIGNGVALAFAGGPLALLIPEDEVELAAHGWADEVHGFKPQSLKRVETLAQAIAKPLAALARGRHRIGFESGGFSQPTTYSAVHVYGGAMRPLLAECFPGAELKPADETLKRLRAEKTSVEIGRIRTACGLAKAAFEEGRASIRAGCSELAIANAFRDPLSTGMIGSANLQRADGFAWCMSGPDSALAAGAYARSRPRRIEPGDLVLVHCNSFADGYWTDITRTYVAGNPDGRQTGIFDAVFEARAAALDAIRPEAAAAAVDRAARAVMEARGFGEAFKHSTGHGVGFGAIDAESLPRLHPASPDTLKSGMVFNVEPAAYFEGYGGVRHCDLVAVTEKGYELLTPFQCGMESVPTS